MLALALGCSAHHRPIDPVPAPTSAPEAAPEVQEVAVPEVAPVDPSHNAEACRAYVQAFDDAPCNPVDLDPTALCPDTLDQASCDLRAYYGCMADAVKCTENDLFLDLSGQANCAPTNCN